jgi:hypothetical protein
MWEYKVITINTEYETNVDLVLTGAPMPSPDWGDSMANPWMYHAVFKRPK